MRTGTGVAQEGALSPEDIPGEGTRDSSSITAHTLTLKDGTRKAQQCHGQRRTRPRAALLTASRTGTDGLETALQEAVGGDGDEACMAWPRLRGDSRQGVPGRVCVSTTRPC